MAEIKTEEFDVRVIPYNMRRGSVTHDQLKAHLAALPDEADHATDVLTPWSTPYADRIKEKEEAE